MNDDDPVRAAAIERLESKRDFRSHAVIYLAVNTILVAIWIASGAGYFWPIWPIVGWGAALALNAWVVYGRRPITEEDIRNETRRDVDHDAASVHEQHQT